jgi:A/G-specific adenine glycosylase
MVEFPSTPWRLDAWPIAEAISLAPVVARWASVPGVVRHIFTHFQLELTLLGGSVRDGAEVDGESWCAPEHFERLALPTLMKKVARLALAALAQPSLALVSPSNATTRTFRAGSTRRKRPAS